MTELLLICALSLFGVVFATSVARWLVQQPAGDPELVRTAAIVSGGVQRYLRRQHVVALALAAVLGAVVFLAYGVAYQTGTIEHTSPREHGVITTIAFVLGAICAVVAAWVASWAERHACARVAAGARRSLDESLQIAMRAGSVSGVVAIALALLGLGGLFLGIYIYFGGLSAEGEALARAPEIPMLLPGFALGAAVVALLGQLGGGLFGKVADLGADIAGKLEGSLPEDAADNPALVADLVGDNVGDGAARPAAMLAAAATESLAAMLIAASVYRRSEDLPSVTAVVLFPLVARTFSLVAAWFGVMVVRTDDTEVPMNAVTRGLYVTTLLYAVGAVGSARWLLGDHWLAFGSCAVLGALCSLAYLYAVQYYTEQRYRPVRSLAESARSGATLATLRGLVTALEGSLALVVVALASMLAAYHVGSQTGLEGGGLFGVAVAVGGMLGSAPYVLAMDAMGSIADCASGIIEMVLGSERPDVRGRARLLDAVGCTARAFTKTVTTSASGLGCLLLAAVFLEHATGAHEAARPNGVLTYVGAVLGLVSVLAFIWATLRRLVIAARDFVNEVRVHLGASADDLGIMARGRLGGLSSDTTGRDPRRVLVDPQEESQLACVEIVSRVALRSMPEPAVIGIAIPVASAVVLRLAATGDNVLASAEALVALLLVATVAGSLGSLLFTNAGSAWDNAKKYIETGAHGGRFVDASGPGSDRDEVDNPTYVAAVVADTIGDPLKGAVGPATQSWLLTLAALALVFLPFFL
jgi:K(+)-stimulated pyrophosphate-energized sodium pump